MAKLYRKIINLVELTKLLERDTVDTLTNTTYLGGRIYPDIASQSNYSELGRSSNLERYPVSSLIDILVTFFSPLYENTTFQLPKLSDCFQISPQNPLPNVSLIYPAKFYERTYMEITDPNGNKTTIYDSNEKEGYEFSSEGNYRIFIHFGLAWGSGSVATYGYVEIQYEIVVISATDTLIRTQPTITSVLERLLAVYTARKVGQPQKYILDPEIAERFKDVRAPEFAFTRCTLRDALDQVGGFIQGIPRLKWDKETESPRIVSFDILGTQPEWKPSESLIEVKNEKSWGMEDLCGQIESYVENFVNTTDCAAGVVTEPWTDFYKTMRTEYGSVRISNDTALFETEFPIYQIEKVEMGFVNNDSVVGDITDFVYERTAYDNLSSYIDNYPFSKAYALVYEQGGNTVTGFQFKLESPLGAGSQRPAIENIIRKKGYSGNIPPYCNLAIRITYIAIISARVKQRKARLETEERATREDNTLFYNQGANLVENNYYGQNMRGTIARMGNEELIKTFIARRYQDVPKPGMWYMINGRKFYISKVNREFNTVFVRFTAVFTPEYNMLSKFIGINSNYRLYDVSERHSETRNINLSENIIVGNREESNNILTSAAVSAYAELLGEGVVSTAGRVSAAYVKTKAKNGNTIGSMLKACAAFACGNSIVLTFGMLDNFSGGAKSVYYDSNQNIQQFVTYGDVYGEFETMEVLFFDKPLIKNGSTNPSFQDQVSLPFQGAVEDLLPQYTEGTGGWILNPNPIGAVELYVKKDSRERIVFTFQAHNRHNRPGIVFGKLLTENSPLIKDVSTVSKKPVVAFFLGELDPVQGYFGKVDLKTDVHASISMEGDTLTISPIKNTTSQTFEAWGLVDPDTNELYLGENLALPPDGETKPIVINF